MSNEEHSLSAEHDERLAEADQEVASLAALCEAIRSLGLRKDFDQLLEHVLVCAHELIGFDHCALMLYDPSRRDLRVSRVHGFGDRHEEVVGLRVPLGRGLTGWAALHQKPVRVGDVRTEPRYVRGLADCLSNMAVPLIIQDQLVGVINVESRRLHAFEERHERLLTVLGSQAALAIVASRARKGFEDGMRQLSALYRISALTWGGQNIDQVVEAVLDEVSRLVPSGSAAVLLPDEDGEHLVFRGAEGYREDVVGMRIPVERGITGRCYRTGEIQHLSDVSADPDYIPGVPDAASEIALPLLVEGKVIGVLNSETSEANGFSPVHVRTLTVIARQVASVLDAIRLQEERLRLAITDPLTGLFNRRYFHERLDETLEGARRYGGDMALLLLDLDHFKAVNDTYGHAAGDRVLQRISAVLGSSTRASDLLARIGGEEFALILLETGGVAARDSADRLRAAVEAAVTSGEEGEEIRVTCSIGVACCRGGEDTTGETLLGRADRALYAAKDAGRNRVEAAS